MWSWFLKELRTTKLVRQKCALHITHRKCVLSRHVGSERRQQEILMRWELHCDVNGFLGACFTFHPGDSELVKEPKACPKGKEFCSTR